MARYRPHGRAERRREGSGPLPRMIERAIEACEGWESPEIRSVVALLTRFEAEAARDEARETTRAILAEATAREAAERERLAADAAWKERWTPIAGAGLRRGRPVETPVKESRTDPVGAILESLPDQIIDWFRKGGSPRLSRPCRRRSSRTRHRPHRGIPCEPYEPGEDSIAIAA